MTIEQELSALTNNFADEKTAVRCRTLEEKQAAVQIFKEHYENVNILKESVDNSKTTWKISCSTPKKIMEKLDLNEADEDIDAELDIDDIDGFDLNDYDDFNDDMDLSDENYDTIDDISEVDKANQLTILKKRAADVAIKWQDMFNQISTLARDIGLIASHDDKFNIELKKADGTKSNYEQDIKDINKELLSDDEEEIDDNFGPSEYDSRAAELKDEPVVKEESLNIEPKTVVNENLLSSSDPNEIPLKADEVDDDF